MSEVPTIGCIVEGAGEERAVPQLLRRIAQDLQPTSSIQVRLARRLGRNKLVNPGGIERSVDDVARELARPCAIFVLLDADDDCPATLGPALLSRARQARGDLPVAVVLAKMEFEAWFLASAESLSGRRGLPARLQPPDWPEDIRDAKGWLRRQMPPGRKYSEVLDQPAFTALFDLQQARAADSFDKCYREVGRLIAALSDLSLEILPPELSGPENFD